jgi:UvrD-like helicase C-terminal domain
MNSDGHSSIILPVDKVERTADRVYVVYSSPSDEWTASLPSWRITLRDDEGVEKAVHMHADEREFQRVVERIKDEAAESRLRWKRLHEFQQSLAQLQSVYCLTVHRSQGSTFQTAFLDLPDIRRREKTNLLEAQQMLYVAVTRPSQRLIVVGD